MKISGRVVAGFKTGDIVRGTRSFAGRTRGHYDRLAGQANRTYRARSLPSTSRWHDPRTRRTTPAPFTPERRHPVRDDLVRAFRDDRLNCRP